MHMTCTYNAKVTVRSLRGACDVCMQVFFFSPFPRFLLDIIILTARRKEANNYVTQKTISPLRLGRFLVLPRPAAASLRVSAPFAT